MLFPPPTPRLKIRCWQDSDTETFITMNRNPAVMEFFPSLYNRNDTLKSIERIKNSFTDNGYGLYALEKIDDGSFVGFTGFSIPAFKSFFTPCVEIGWRLNHRHWGQGYATEAAVACMHFGFTILEFDLISSFTSTLNTQSIHVMEKIGLKFSTYFDHPLITNGNRLKPHVLYSLDKATYLKG